VFPTIAAPGDQGISPIGRGGHLPKREDRGNPYQGSPAHWEGYYSSPSQGKGYFELYYFVGDLITLGWKNLLKSNTKGVRTVASLCLADVAVYDFHGLWGRLAPGRMMRDLFGLWRRPCHQRTAERYNNLES
jgi:hypothetical protein